MATKYDKIDLFENYPVPKAVMTLVLPSVAATVVMMLYTLADTYFVGMLDNAVETSAVTLAAPVILAFNAINNLFGIGCSSKISRALGEKDYDTVRITSSMGFYLAIISGILFSLIVAVFNTPLLKLLGADDITLASTKSYLFWTAICGAAPAILNVVMAQIVKADGSANHAAIGTMSGCILNVILDPIFILPWGFNMGAAGAGCATFISNSVASLYFVAVIIIRRNKSFVTIDPKWFKPNAAILKDVCGVGIPGSVQNLLNVTGMTILNNFMSAYGAEAVSAVGISHKVSLLPLYIAMGISQGIMALVGYNFASGNKQRMRDVISYTAKIIIGFMLVVTAVFVIFSGNIIQLFMKNETIVSYGSEFLRAMSFAQPFLAVDFLAVGLFQACGMGKKAFVFAILRKIVLEIPAMIILNKIYPMYGLAYAQLCAELILAIVAIFEIRKLVE